MTQPMPVDLGSGHDPNVLEAWIADPGTPIPTDATTPLGPEYRPLGDMPTGHTLFAAPDGTMYASSTARDPLTCTSCKQAINAERAFSVDLATGATQHDTCQAPT